MPTRFRQRLRAYKYSLGPAWPVIVGVLVFALLFNVGVVGFMLIEDWGPFDAWYMTAITLTTVGFLEVHELSKAGRTFTAFLAMSGAGAFMFMAGSTAQLLVEGRLAELLGKSRVRKAISNLHDHFIICGFGRIGRIVAREIAREGHPLVVIENDVDTIRELGEEGHLFIQGDATSDKTLTDAGIDKAQSLISALHQEAANVYVVLTARQMNPNITIIARADNETHIKRLKMAGADRVVLPHTIGGVRMAQSVLRPTVISFLELAFQHDIDLSMEELSVSPDSPLVGKDLAKSGLRPEYNLIVIAVNRKGRDMLFNPPPLTVIEAGDVLVAVGASENLSRVKDIL